MVQCFFVLKESFLTLTREVLKLFDDFRMLEARLVEHDFCLVIW
jgi:hypothetical protein